MRKFMKLLISLLALIICMLLLAFSQIDQTSVAAFKFHPNIAWRKHSVVRGDFSCNGKTELAILGLKESEIIVAVFMNGITKPPILLRDSSKYRDSNTVELSIEDGEFDEKDFQEMLGDIPDGLKSSKTCKWLRLSDGKIDSAHIYWNRTTKSFGTWSL